MKLVFVFALSIALTYLSSLAVLKYLSSLYCKVKPELKDVQGLKEGTPNVGGISVLIGALISASIFIPFEGKIIFILLSILGYSVLGLIDDLSKMKTSNGDGLTSKVKLILQFSIAFLVVLYGDKNGYIGLGLSFLEKNTLLVIFLRRFLMTFFIVYFVNAYNITDGIDGLAASITFPVIGVLIMIVLSFEGSSSILTLLVSFLGALLVFLQFNKYPASYFMGDCGSLSLGALLASVALVLKVAPLFLLATLVFSVELFTSLIQIIAIRKFNRKVFLIAPIHHVYEKKGRKETSIVKTFSSYSAFSSIIALLVFAHFYL